MKNALAIGFIVFMAYSGLNGVMMMNENNKSSGNMVSGIMDGINKAAPVMVDSEIRLDGASLENENLAINYTLVNNTKDEVDVAKFDDFIKSDAKSKICDDKELKEVLYQEGGFFMTYKDKDKQPVTRINLNKSLCDS